jgi:hypothetical protein
MLPPLALMTQEGSVKLILLELNELSPDLMAAFIEAGELPNFRRLREESTLYSTDAGEDPPNLEPWVQWITVHTGVPFSKHGVATLGDADEKLRYPGIGKIVSDSGGTVGICGSMNAGYGALRGYVVPDPWSKSRHAHPSWLAGYYDFVARRVQESSRNGGGSMTSNARFLATLLRTGVSAKTIWETARQLVAERVDRGIAWRKACLLDLFQYDVFHGLNARYNVQFATFFSNSVAHFQHYYWRHMSPELFPVPPPASDHVSLRDAIRTGFRFNDSVVGRVLKDYPQAIIVFCTGLSQIPWTETQKVTYRPRDFTRLLRFAGIESERVQIFPVMAEQFHVKCQDSRHAHEVAGQLRDITINGTCAMFTRLDGNSVFAGCSVFDWRDGNEIVSSRTGNTGTRFADLFYMIHTMRSGRHARPGMLWIRSGRSEVVAEKISVSAIAPTILMALGISPPEYMKERPVPV